MIKPIGDINVHLKLESLVKDEFIGDFDDL